MAKTYNFLFYLDIAAPLLILILAVLLFYFKKRKIFYPDYLLLYFLIYQAALNTLAPVLQFEEINNHWIYHLNCLVSVVIFSAYFYRSLNRERLVISGFIIFLIFWVINLIFFQPYYTFNSYSYALGASMIVLFSLLSFQSIIKKMPTKKILSLKDFWILTALLTYFGSCFFIFISYNYLSGIDPKNVGLLWYIHNIFLALTCFIFFKALYINNG